MKKVNVKDANVAEVEKPDTQEETKKFNFKKLMLIIAIVVVSLVGVFFWSTKVRWDAEIKEYYEVLYYGQEDIKIKELTGFYGDEIDIKLDEYSAVLAYCDSEYGGKCVTGDFNNGFENLLRNPSIVINIVILIDLLLVFVIIKDKYYGKVKTYVIFGVVLAFGIFNVGKVIFEVADYYAFVNNSKYVTTAIISRQLVTDNKKEYYPVVTYNSEQGEFTTYIDVPMNGEVKDDLPDKNELTVYYDKDDNSIVTAKKSLFGYLLPLIIGIAYISVAIRYLVVTNKKNK